MTVKEKSTVIVKQFKGFEMPNEEIASVQCAIIHVKGIIDELESIFNGKGKSSAIVYWQEVIRHLNQM